MKLLKADKASGVLEVVPQSLDDFWHLEKHLESGDIVSGSTERKIKPRFEGDKALKVMMYVELRLEKVEYDKNTHALRLSGVMVGGKPEELTKEEERVVEKVETETGEILPAVEEKSKEVVQKKRGRPKKTVNTN